MSSPDRPEWIGSVEAARIIGRTPRAVLMLAEAGHIKQHRPPGLRPRFLRSDVERFAPPVATPSHP